MHGWECCKCNQLIDTLQLKWLCLLHPQFSRISLLNIFMLQIYKVKVFVRSDLAIYGLYLGPFLYPSTWAWLFQQKMHLIPKRTRSPSFFAQCSCSHGSFSADDASCCADRRFLFPCGVSHNWGSDINKPGARQS